MNQFDQASKNIPKHRICCDEDGRDIHCIALVQRSIMLAEVVGNELVSGVILMLMNLASAACSGGLRSTSYFAITRACDSIPGWVM